MRECECVDVCECVCVCLIGLLCTRANISNTHTRVHVLVVLFVRRIVVMIAAHSKMPVYTINRNLWTKRARVCVLRAYTD